MELGAGLPERLSDGMAGGRGGQDGPGYLRKFLSYP